MAEILFIFPLRSVQSQLKIRRAAVSAHIYTNGGGGGGGTLREGEGRGWLVMFIGLARALSLSLPPCSRDGPHEFFSPVSPPAVSALAIDSERPRRR